MTAHMSRAEALALPPASTMADLARLLAVSEPTVREMRRTGRLDAMGVKVLQVGRQWRVVTSTALAALGIDGARNGDGPDPPARPTTLNADAHQHNRLAQDDRKRTFSYDGSTIVPD